MRAAILLVLTLLVSGCLHRPTDNPNVIVVGVTSGPNNLDPRIGTDDVSGKISQLVFNNLMTLDEHLQVVPDLAERLDHPDPTTWVATLRPGVRFHDGHELTSADVVYTFRSLLDPKLLSPRKGAYKMVQAIDARDRYTVVFTLKEPFGSFPAQLVLPIVPDGAGPAFREHPVGTGPYRFVAHVVDDRVELAPFVDYFGGRPANEGLVLRVVPDDIMRGLELRKGTIDIVINDLAPDVVYQLQRDARLQVVTSPGTDYQYVGVNLRDPILQDVRVRQAIAYAIDRDAIIKYLRRGLAIPASGMLPPMSWAFEPNVATYAYDPTKARALLDDAGYPVKDGIRFQLTLKVSNLEFNRLQSTVIQQNLRDVGIALDIRTYEFATFYADVLKGNFQLFTLQWVGGAVADPDILRRVFHSGQVPPNGFNRGFFHNARIDSSLDRAAAQDDVRLARPIYDDVQREVALDVPYISLWCKTNVVVAQRSLTGFHLLPTLDFIFLKNVSRTTTDQRAAR
ncbi:MAG: ABC transporter substrate-binding protein [Acidobacteriia bacterium]|nr:ABC transporter substrate-binding protein [Terriglobia bacterium]